RSTAEHILLRFSYCFVSPPGSEYPPILDHRGIEAGESRSIEGKGGAVTLSAFILQHGNIPALGYRIADAAYTPDVSDIPAESWPHLENLDLWIIDGLRYAGHPSHFSVNDALAWIYRFKPRRAVITNMHSDLDYEVLRQSLPPHVIPAHDGMRLTLELAGWSGAGIARSQRVRPSAGPIINSATKQSKASRAALWIASRSL